MAKLIMAALAALCISQVVVANEKAMKMGFSPAEIIEDVEKILANAEKVVDKVDADVQIAIVNIANTINATLVAVAEKWEEEVEVLVEKAQNATKNIEQCLEGGESIKTVVEEVRGDILECMSKRIQAVRAAEEEVKELLPQISELAKTLKALVKSCVAKKNPVFITVCLAENAPVQFAKIAGLDTKIVALSAIVAEKIGELAPLSGLCIAKCLAGRAAEVARNIQYEISCIAQELL